jgi:hypothetical protein
MSVAKKLLLALLACSAPAVSGCEGLQRIFGLQGKYLLRGYDEIATPGERLMLRARLEKGSFLLDQKGKEVCFWLDGQLLGAARTDGDGLAAIPFTPQAAGDRHVTVTFSRSGPGRPEVSDTLLVACRNPETPIAVVDIDLTLTGADFRAVLTRDPPPLPDAVRVMNRLQQDYTILYLTGRLEHLERRSKTWLAGHGFPRGPMFLSTFGQLFRGNREYKGRELSAIRRRFRGPGIGIGDKISDAVVYADNGLRAVLLVSLKDPNDPEDLRELADHLDRLPAGVQVVWNWDELEQAVFEGVAFPARQAQERLRYLADSLTRKT